MNATRTIIKATAALFFVVIVLPILFLAQVQVMRLFGMEPINAFFFAFTANVLATPFIIFAGVMFVKLRITTLTGDATPAPPAAGTIPMNPVPPAPAVDATPTTATPQDAVLV